MVSWRNILAMTAILSGTVRPAPVYRELIAAAFMSVNCFVAIGTSVLVRQYRLNNRRLIQMLGKKLSSQLGRNINTIPFSGGDLTVLAAVAIAFVLILAVCAWTIVGFGWGSNVFVVNG